MWDLVNHAKFMSVTKNFYQGAHGIVVVFDATRESSFENLGLWDKNIKELAQHNVTCVLCANKQDLKGEIKVDNKRTEAFAKTNKMKAFQTSTVTGQNMQEALQYIVFDCLNKEMVR